MRGKVSLALSLPLALSIGVAGIVVPTVAVAQSPEDAAKALYEEGRKAYRLGDYATAATKFEEAYAASDLPAILYNVGLAYLKKFDLSHDIGDLRKSKAVFENFYLEAQRDESLGDLAEIEKQIKELDDKIAQAEADEKARKEAEAAAAQNANNNASGPEGPTAPAGPDPGREAKIGGIIAMSAGSVSFVSGLVVGAFMLDRSNFFQREYDNEGCPDNAAADCTTIADNGRAANLYGYSIGIPLMVIGAAGVGVGAWLYLKGKKKTQEWQGGTELSIMPTPGGLTISGRF